MNTAAKLIAGVFLCICSAPTCWTAPFDTTGGSERAVFRNVSNFSIILLDPASGTLYLGARDAILAVDPSDLSGQYKQIEWDVPEDRRRSCVAKGKTEGDCHNYIRLLEFLGDGQIYACGTYAFDPQCTIINTSSFSLERAEDGSVRMETGKGKCPFEPSQHYTAVMADGVLYTAATSNFLGTLFDISRATGNEGERIRTERSMNWLSDPEFVSSAFIRENEHNPAGEDDKIYFFFTEVAKEYDLYTKVKVPRVARVCKGDVGGMKTLQKRWTSFLKAQLVCEDRASGQRYNILTDVYTTEHQPGDPSSTHFYGIFTSQWEREPLSAVCVYSLHDITKVMEGPFKELKKNCENWINPEPVPSPRPGQCITSGMRAAGIESSLKLPDKVLTFVRDHPLMENSVVAAPLVVRRGITYTKVAITFSAAGNQTILHLGTDRGELHRVSVVGQNATLLLETPLFPEQEPVNNILLHKGQVLVGSPLSLVRLSAEGCDVFRGSEKAQGQCVSVEAHCTTEEKKLAVMEGLRVLLPCVQVSARLCSWKHPPDRHTRQHHSDLEVTMTRDNQGAYNCSCEEGGREQPLCLRASYQLVLESPLSGNSLALDGAGVERQWLAVYLLCVVFGAALGACLFCFVCPSRSAPGHHPTEKGRDLLPSSDTPQSPSSTSLLSEGVPLTEKRNGMLNGHGAIYSNHSGLKLQESAVNLAEELDGKEKVGLGLEMEGMEEEIASGLEEFSEIKIPRGAPLAQCEESSI